MKNLYLFLLFVTGIALAAPPVIQNPTPLVVCDIDGNGSESVDVTIKNAEILGSLDPALYTVSWYGDMAHTIAFINFSSVPSTLLYVQVTENANPSNFATATLEIVVLEAPQVTMQTASTNICPGSAQLQFTGTGAPAPYVFYYSINGTPGYEAVSDASGNATINTPTLQAGDNIIVLESVVINGGCQFFLNTPVLLTIHVDATMHASPADLVAYESPTDGFATFDLTQNTTTIVGNNQNLTVTYYTTFSDSLAGTNPIANPAVFTNTNANAQMVYTGVLNDLTGCYSTDSFMVYVQDANFIFFEDAVLKALLTNPDISSSVVKDAALQPIVLDTNADGEITPAEAAAAYYIEIPNMGIHYLIGLERFSSLKWLDASHNGLVTSVVLNNMPNLQHLDVSHNDYWVGINVSASGLHELFCNNSWVPVLNVAGCASLQNIQADTNNLDNLDVTGLSQLQTLSVYLNNISSLNLSGLVSLQTLDVRNNQLSALDLSGISTLQTLNCNSNHLTSLDVSGQSGLQTLACAANNIASLDLALNPALQTLHCNDNELTTLDCSQNHMLSYLRCYTNQLQTLFIKNGSNETFDPANWIENPNLAYICADESQIASIQAAAGSGVSVNSYCTFNPGGDHNTITGFVRFDANDNGCDALDVTPPFIKVNINDGLAQGSTFTNTNSSYTFYTGAGNETITPDLENPSFFTVSPSSALIEFPTVNNTVASQDFCLVANGVNNDLEVVIAPVIPARPGFDAVYKIVYRNKGNTTMSLDSGVTLTYSPNVLTYVQADVAPSLQSANSINWDYANLMPFESRSIEVIFHVNSPSDTPQVNVNDILSFTAVISPNNLDETIPDNTFIFNQTVVGSYDPNEITCVEGDVVSPAEIGNYLHYMVNFENTGTDVAENIVVKMTIDPAQYDISSMRILNSSDGVTARITGNIAEFIFQDIKLPIGGHGNILLKMKSKNDLTAGATVTSNADIYFDYNLPVSTNPANTLYQLLGLPDQQIDNAITVFPNPSHGMVNIKAATNIQSVQVYDVQGRLLQTSLRSANDVSVDISGQQTGVYFLKIKSDKGIKVEKIVKK